MHSPPVQSMFLSHALPHRPQFRGSFWRFVQLVPQQVRASPQAGVQTPPPLPAAPDEDPPLPPVAPLEAPDPPPPPVALEPPDPAPPSRIDGESVLPPQPRSSKPSQPAPQQKRIPMGSCYQQRTALEGGSG
jgi:hypothetical protein